MTDRERVLAWFDTGALMRPCAEELNFVDLVRALTCLCGLRTLPAGDGVRQLAGMIGEHERYLFVLVDGLGLQMLDELAPGSFLRQRLVADLRSVFLSTTAAALPTLATGQWPATHGLPGWWTHLADKDVTAVVLPFRQRNAAGSLASAGVCLEELYPVPSVWPQLTHSPQCVLPAKLRKSVFTRYFSGNTDCIGYSTLGQAMDIARQSVLDGAGPNLTYLYLPQLDSELHVKGTKHLHVRRVLSEIDARLGQLATSVQGQVRILISADHGQVDVPAQRTYLWTGEDRLAQCLICQPSGEPSVPIFHVRPGREAEFRELFAEGAGDHFALLTPGEVADLRLLGPELPSPMMMQRLGTFMGIGAEPAKLYVAPWRADQVADIGVHGGMRPAEMCIPLVVA